MHGKRLAALGIAMLVVVAVGGGCGSDGDGGEITASSITKPEYIKQVNAICAKRNRELEEQVVAYIKKIKFNAHAASVGQYVTIVEKFYVPAAQREIDEIRALGAPKGDEDEVTKLVAAREEALETAETKPSEIVDASQFVFENANELAKEYGITQCVVGIR